MLIVNLRASWSDVHDRIEVAKWLRAQGDTWSPARCKAVDALEAWVFEHRDNDTVIRNRANVVKAVWPEIDFIELHDAIEG